MPELCLKLDRRISPCPGVPRLMWACSGLPGKLGGAPCAKGCCGQHLSTSSPSLKTVGKHKEAYDMLAY